MTEGREQGSHLDEGGGGLNTPLCWKLSLTLRLDVSHTTVVRRLLGRQ